MQIPKVKPFRSKKYLEYIRSLDCVGCEWPAELGFIEAHHIRTGGTSTKCGDDETVPLCNENARGCHGRADKSRDSYERYRAVAERLAERWKSDIAMRHKKTEDMMTATMVEESLNKGILNVLQKIDSQHKDVI